MLQSVSIYTCMHMQMDVQFHTKVCGLFDYKMKNKHTKSERFKNTTDKS